MAWLAVVPVLELPTSFLVDSFGLADHWTFHLGPNVASSFSVTSIKVGLLVMLKKIYRVNALLQPQPNPKFRLKASHRNREGPGDFDPRYSDTALKFAEI